MELNISNVSKLYRGGNWGLKNFSLKCEKGVIGLLGPNGAGKSTLMRILATVTKPTEGNITWDGVDIAQKPDAVRKVLGYLPQDFGIYPHLNPVEFLSYIATAKGIDAASARKRIDQLLELTNLSEYRKRKLGGFSGGMRQRVGIAQALLNDPKLLVVDEPTTGLDPEERIRFRNLLVELAGDRIVLLSTHIVSDVEATVTDIVIIKKGNKLLHASPDELIRQVTGKSWEFIVPSAEFQQVKESRILSKTVRTESGIRVRVVADSSPDATAQPVSPSLEDGYLYLLSQAGPEGRVENEN